ncbi:phosphoglycolate phosphatase-like HAD superfamily hydrolase [Arcticibacter pallidicorallinus]|uniref:Phosphoglycolate phosphatase-like HAD superfamily hydrolase n=1 Tax=Arcticibacter pallidicorallinus TaxID=1259464 RepID=A0A2T0U606_9SPHI|nr:HAD hydrolase-like protein [Arcticibacter pallidicorallinus]PRY53355.1 phosphoglycolate phosphatase-like HAD superfamily hydrolase [Arcticibacter pallidicorallinus]
MINYSDFDPSKKAFIFELDNVLYPEKDYLLQVYYLFANFLEYIETVPPAGDLIAFMQKSYEHQGKEGIFDSAQEVFGIDEKYRENFLRLHREAKLPLKLLLYKEMLDLLQQITVDRKQIFLVTAGNPIQQLNKIRHMEWNGLENYLKVFFTDELEPKPAPGVLINILKDNSLDASEVVLIGTAGDDELFAKNAAIEFVSV